MSNGYGFEVEAPGVETAGETYIDATWGVGLPHQCDTWVIASSENPEDAIRRMEQFIAEAQAALEILRNASQA